MHQRDFNTLNLILFTIFTIAFLSAALKYGSLSLDFRRVERSLEVERIARERLTTRVLAAEKRPDINVKYGNIIIDERALLVIKEEEK